ncbi:MAG: hypothetical protein Q8896_12530 [Bacteroidota bacterium]|nr:hypothetical protein [Bacteroidota bacterium]MDP4235923.1 hypothetical protein [Bacteroidota bacterium]
MNTNIAKIASINAEIPASGSTSVPDLVSDFQMSLRLLEKSIRFGWKREIYHSIAFYNIKTFDQTKSEGKTFHDFLDEMKVSPSGAKRYLRIGKRLTELVCGEQNETAFLSEEHLDKLCTEIPNGERITLRGLDKASSTLQLFQRYLRGEISELELSRIPTKLHAEEKKQMPTPIIQSTTATSERLALELWNRLEEKLLPIPKLLYEDIERYGSAFIKTYQDAGDDLREQVAEKFREANTMLTKIKSLLSALHRCDLTDAAAIYQDNEP